MLDPRDGLRVALTHPRPPASTTRTAWPTTSSARNGTFWAVVKEFTFDRLLDALRGGVAACPVDGAGERLTLSDDGRTLEVRTFQRDPVACARRCSRSTSTSTGRLPHRRSIIHGDLHTRNVIVSPRGMPYYIDFSDTGIGPTLFDFIKHESYLWCWSLAGVPDGAGPAECTLTEAVRLMRALTRPRRPLPRPPDAAGVPQRRPRRLAGQVLRVRRDDPLPGPQPQVRAGGRSGGRRGAGLLPAPGPLRRPDAPLVPPRSHRPARRKRCSPGKGCS